MSLQHNIPGMRNITIGKTLDNKMAKTMRKLSSGYRVNAAADDAASLSISEKVRAKMAEQAECIRNVNQGIGVAQTADAALMEVNDMLHRAEVLCVQAANGTYSAEERQAMTDEVNAIYDEMERIFDTAQFNTIQLFKQRGDSAHYEYNETVTPLPDGQLVEWGDMSSITDIQVFDLAKDAKPATVTFKPDPSVDMNDASTLVGKSFLLENPQESSAMRVTFTDSGSFSIHSLSDGAHSSYREARINISSCTTVQDALDLLCDHSQNSYYFTKDNLELDKDNTTVNADGTITLSFDLDPLVQTINGTSYKTENGDGKNANELVVSGVPDFTMNALDPADNTPRYSKLLSSSLELLPGLSGPLTDDQKSALLSNSLSLSGESTYTVSLASYTGITTAEEARAAIVTELNRHSPHLSAHLDPSDATRIVVTYDCDPFGSDPLLDTLKPAALSERYEDGIDKTASAPTVSTSVTPATNEAPGSCSFTLSADAFPLAVTLDGSSYLFYPHKDGQKTEPHSYDADSLAGVCSQLASIIRYRHPDTEVTVSGSTITVTGKYAAQDPAVSLAGTTCDFKVFQRIFLPSDSFYLETSCTIPFDLSLALPDPTRPADLDGSGFQLSLDKLYFFEFSSGPDPVDPAATKIDTSGCTSYADLAKRIEDLLNTKFSYYIKNRLQHPKSDPDDYIPISVTADENGTFSLQIPTLNYSFKFSDHRKSDSLFAANQDGTVVSRKPMDSEETAGTVSTQPQTVLDFSSYNTPEKVEKLFGTGFRVTCATCEGEFINVIFCHDTAKDQIPPTFELPGVTDADGNPITIRNFPIQLKDMNNGTDIVKAINDQLSGQLDHFTDVAIGDPASRLIVMDKRAGNLQDTSGNPARAEVLNGIYTNFNYDIDIDLNLTPGSGIGGSSAFFGTCMIFAGEEGGEVSLIPVNLPNLSLKQLFLDPPRPDLSDLNSLDDLMERLKAADSVITAARSQLGADQNRLEHTAGSLGLMHEINTATFSQLRDADIAAEMMEQTKLSILKNLQQAALVHINQDASAVLELIH